MPAPRCPLLTADCVIFRGASVALIRRGNPPFQGSFALPGGFAEVGETVEAACAREVLEETGLVVSGLRLVGVYSDPARDPRGHIVTVAFLAGDVSGELAAGDDAADAEWVADWRSVPLAFDHARILADAERVRGAGGVPP